MVSYFKRTSNERTYFLSEHLIPEEKKIVWDSKEQFRRYVSFENPQHRFCLRGIKRSHFKVKFLA